MLFKAKRAQRKGTEEEIKAGQYLEKQGFIILEHSFACKGGEIDLIAQQGEQLHFIEVKARKNTLHGHPSEFVTPTKQKRIIKCAQIYLLKHPQYQHWGMQFDVISFIDEKIEWLPNAFSAF